MRPYRNLKRPIEFVVALSLLLILSPLYLIIALLVFLGDRHHVLYKGRRVGRGGSEFDMLKFRTMRVDADQVGPSSTSNDDPRITRVGHALRRTKLDELPQLWNVVRGEMSLVGPRPQVRWAVDLYTAEERTLLTVRPGITDFASLAFRNEGEILAGSTDPDNDYLKLIAPGKTQLGLLYIKDLSFANDFRIIVATIMAVLGKDPDWCLPMSWRVEH
jgi:lipopolysaccharide/colanic/teichoic acid biosynthesis glycosyltransferase